jgi:hypothetical protein
MPHIVQEFYCNKCPGYVTVRLQTDFNRRVLLVCPKCQRKHQRVVKDGILYDVGKVNNEGNIEEIHIPLSGWSETARTTKMVGRVIRDGVPIHDPRDLIESSWFDRYGDRT